MGFTTQRAGLARICRHCHQERAADGPIRLIQLKFQSFNVSATLGGLVPRRTLGAGRPRRRSRAGLRSLSAGLATLAPLSAAMNSSAIAGNGFQLPMNAIGILAKAIHMRFVTCTCTAALSALFAYSAQAQSPPTVTLSASPTSIPSGQSSTLSWTSANATACSGTGKGFSPSGPSGSIVSRQKPRRPTASPAPALADRQVSRLRWR